MKNSPQWPFPSTRYFGSPLVLFHAGLGPGDTLGHKEGAPSFIQKKLLKIAHSVQKRLTSDSALELSTFTVAQLERESIFNAGKGAKLQRDGIARLSASVMDGRRQRMAGVSNLQGFVHASAIAKSLMNKKDRVLTGLGASRYALEEGFSFESAETDDRRQEWLDRVEGETGTVGAVALGREMKTAAATSTGGRGFEQPGRVSDSFTPAGNFANSAGAVSCTGVGEDILDTGLAIAVLARMEDGMSLQEAVARAFLRQRRRHFGLIAIDSNGQALVHATRGTLSFGIVTPKQVWVGMLPENWSKVASN